MGRILFILIFSCTTYQSNASTLFAPDGDTALLIQLLGTEIEATAGILQILEVSSKTVDKIEQIHYKIDDTHTRALQAEYYTQRLSEFPKKLEKIESIRNMRNNMYSTKNLYQDRNTLTMGYDLLKHSGQQASSIAHQDMRINRIDRKLAKNYLRGAGNVSTTGGGAIYGARASALGTMKLIDIDDSINLLNYQLLVRNDYILAQERKKEFEEFATKQYWGMIDPEISFEEYKKGSLKTRGRIARKN